MTSHSLSPGEEGGGGGLEAFGENGMVFRGKKGRLVAAEGGGGVIRIRHSLRLPTQALKY